jgi:hypothetical protein
MGEAGMTEQRVLQDRRKQAALSINKYIFWGGRRRKRRRDADRKTFCFPDYYSPRLFFACILLILLCAADAYFTLELINRNLAKEANPIMAYCLKWDCSTFVALKIFMTSVSIVILCLLSNFLVAVIGLSMSVLVYILVILYELNLLYHFFPDLIRP